MPSWGYLIIILLVILVLLSAFFSASEIVYATVNKIKLHKANEAGDKRAKAACILSDNYSKLISTILIGNNLVNIAASSAATVLAMEIWPENGATIAAISMTVIILIFGEILPKTVLAKFNYSTTLRFARPLQLFNLIFKPVVFIVTKFVDSISKIWTPKAINPTATDEELITMVDEIEEEGFIDEDTSELIRSAIDFTEATAHEIMVPRVDVFAYDIEDDIDELINDPNIFKYSRVPVYKDSIDNIIGILNTKILIKALLAEEKINILDVLTEPIYVHKTKSISSILKEFKQSHTHIAIVKDEFGGTMGIITLEDILEELVGDIWDEVDEVEEEIVKNSEGVYTIDGDMNIYDFFELVDLDDKNFDSEYTTIGGWCTEILERFPKPNDTFDYKNITVTILEVDNIRVEKVKVEVHKVEENEED